MSKKVKSFQYAGRKEFVEDLERIWENCLTYNTLPVAFHVWLMHQESIYRVHAFAMQRRANELLKQVPDIALKNKSNDELGESESDDGNSFNYSHSGQTALSCCNLLHKQTRLPLKLKC